MTPATRGDSFWEIEMRARWLKPEAFRDRKLAKCGPAAFVVYHALRCMADDGGTAPADADLIYGQMFFRWPQVPLITVSVSLHVLFTEGLITLFTVGVDTYAKIHDWSETDIPHPGKFRNPQLEVGQVLTLSGTTVPQVVLSESSVNPHHLDTYIPRHLDTQTLSKTPDVVGLKDKPSKAKKTRTNALPKYPHFNTDQCGRLYELWVKHRGAVEYSVFRRALGPLYEVADPPTEQEVSDAIIVSREYVEEMDQIGARIESIHTFAKGIREWIRLGKQPTAIEGILTERGEMAGSKALRLIRRGGAA